MPRKYHRARRGLGAEGAAKILGGARREGNGNKCLCPVPAHDDRTASLHITDRDDGGLLVNCFAGCDQASVIEAMRALGVDVAPPCETDMRPRQETPGRSSRKSADDDWTLIMPVPEEAPAPPIDRASATWCYRDAEGRPLCYMARSDARSADERKTFFPVTFWEHTSGRREWRRKAAPTPRPLYGLELLAVRPDAPVLVTEGEKSADAARDIFPEFVVVTSPNGAEAARQADWSVLSGKHVSIWPDADESGRDYAADVARLAKDAGAVSISLVAVPEGWPQGWDLADALPDGVTRCEIVRMQESARQVRPSAVASKPDAWLPKGFRVDDDRGISEVVDVDEETGKVKWGRVCSPLRVIAATRDSDGRAWGRLIEVQNREGIWNEWAMPMASTAGSGEEYRRGLLDMGLEIEPGSKPRNALHRLLTGAKSSMLARCVSRLGWHGNCFVLPDEVIGDTGHERLVLQTETQLMNNFRIAGSLDEWQEGIGALAIGNTRLVFASSAAFAAPLLNLLGDESGGFHYRGGSSSGKTTALEVAGSVWGGGSAGYKTTWRATDNGLEGIAAVHSDALLCLDEMGQVDGEKAGAIAYMLANGVGKQRAGRDGTPRARHAWRSLFLSSGEIGLADKVREGSRGQHRRVMAGQEIRILDIAADADAGIGLFEDIHGRESARAFADELKAAARTIYGTPARRFLHKLTADPEAAAAFAREAKADFIDSIPKNADGQVQRAAGRFALVAAAGELATAFGITGWREGEAKQAARRMFRDWLQGRSGTEPAEITAGIAAVRSFLEAHGGSRFSPKSGEVVSGPIKRAGFYEKDGDGRRYFILPGIWKEEVLAGHDALSVGRAMAERGLLMPGENDRPAFKVRLPGMGSTRAYVVLPAIFNDDR